MKHLLIVYASQTGHTFMMAESVRRGAMQLADEVETRMLPALQAGLDDLLWCDALLLGTPENFGYMAGALKDFLDRTYYPAQGQVEGLPFAVFISAGNDGTGALTAIERIARGYPLQNMAPPIICKGELTAMVLLACEELGATAAAGLSCGLW
ncbi:multimeric flavodoxin WrbA [Chitinivorax tropicus]|uniref:Flavoprotein WrbA n=1 Tax=Chitinivorax tropicus TaxID=714531 RepID=A0A840MK72_9PROT|nr:NAD(P)H-dependent oxidoreductase [Chitinivorax tropicus]MBB5017102.1 multimeric flavodoxin WrbA [Chitinivorax tropicus]